MVVNKTVLLILDKARGRLRIEPLDGIDGEFGTPFIWRFLGCFKGAQVIDQSFCIWRVADSKVVGFAGPKTIGSSVANYIWWMLITIPFLQMPTLFHFTLVDRRQLDLEEARSYVDDIIQDSKLLPDVKARLSQRIRRAKSVAAMARAIDDARE